MPIIFYNGQLLFDHGQLAMSTACCCNACCNALPDVINATYTNGCSTVSFTFNAKDGAGNTIPECASLPSFTCNAQPVVAYKCWYSGTITIRCTNPVSPHGTCDEDRIGQFYLLCTNCGKGGVGTQLMIYATDFCYPLGDEIGPPCLPPPATAECNDQNVMCDAVTISRTARLQWKTAFPCAMCNGVGDVCDCITIDMTW